ncbi:hypothetical protein SAMCCGM7_pC0845 (plasmid) [Sinorhizobium americanum CCGM7]|nr:hypothetical protein SAMCCGM7_pC0845 [Sinorhizobium americanum CCGM7]
MKQTGMFCFVATSAIADGKAAPKTKNSHGPYRRMRGFQVLSKSEALRFFGRK